MVKPVMATHACPAHSCLLDIRAFSQANMVYAPGCSWHVACGASITTKTFLLKPAHKVTEKDSTLSAHAHVATGDNSRTVSLASSKCGYLGYLYACSCSFFAFFAANNWISGTISESLRQLRRLTRLSLGTNQVCSVLRQTSNHILLFLVLRKQQGPTSSICSRYGRYSAMHCMLRTSSVAELAASLGC